MNYSTITNATAKNSVPTIQCRVQKHTPEARKISVAAMSDCIAIHDCMGYWMEDIL